MNQILITQKLYITPELKRKKKLYKIYFLLSAFLVCILASVYIYAEYDRNKSEEVSQDLLESVSIASEDNKQKQVNKDVLTVILNSTSEEENSENEETQNILKSTKNQLITTNIGGYNATTIGSIKIPKINIEYPILLGENPLDSEESVKEIETLLKSSPCKYWGPDINEVGNLCIVGHNYRNTKFFSKVLDLTIDDEIYLTNLENNTTLKYVIYDKYTVIPEDISCTDQVTYGKKEVTLITCTNDNKQRVIVKAREAK